MYKVKKRSGEIVDFNLNNIQSVLYKTFKGKEVVYTEEIIKLLSLQSVSKLTFGSAGPIVTVEDIQDAVEQTLIDSGYRSIAKDFILYRDNHKKIRENTLNYSQLVNSYLKALDWRVKENSTVQYSLGGLILNNSGAVTANYWLQDIYDREIGSAHKSGAMHIHDLSMLSGYCAGWSLKQLIQEGLGGVEGKISSAPAKHLSTLCNQMVNFLGIMQNE